MLKIAEKIREQFPILKTKIHGKPLVYLDNAATTQKPISVIAAETAFYATSNANAHRGVYALAERATADYVAAHQRVAQFIGAKSFEEIVFTKNTTEAINLVAGALSDEFFRGKKKILITAMEHHSNLLPWQRLASRRGLRLDFVEITKDGQLDLADLKNKLTEETAILAITHISNVLGTVNPIDKIVKMAHKAGALVLVDAAQSVARLPIDVQKLDIDFLVFSGHKMYGPLGIGVLYGKRAVLEKMPPFLLGGDMVKTVTRENAVWNDLPWKFEAGTPNLAGAIGVVAAIDFIERVGLKDIWKHEQALVNYIMPKLLAIDGLRIVGANDIVGEHLRVLPCGRTQRSAPTAKPLVRAGVISFTVDGIHSHDLASLLDLEGVAVRSGQHCAQPLLETLGIKECARISFGATTTIAELDDFIVALKKSIKILRGNG